MYIPTKYDDMLRQCYALDIRSFMSYYSPSDGLRACVEKRGSPLSYSRMLILPPTVYWNRRQMGVWMYYTVT